MSNSSVKYDSKFNSFISYFNSIGMNSKAMIDRVFYFYQLWKKLCPETIIDILVENRFDKDKAIEYTALNFFTKNYIVCAGDFVSNINLSSGTYTQHYLYWNAHAENYDFVKANDKSSLVFEVFPNVDESLLTLRAVGINCDSLFRVMNKYLLPYVAYPIEKSTSGPMRSK